LQQVGKRDQGITKLGTIQMNQPNASAERVVSDRNLTVDVKREDPDKPEIRALLVENDAYYEALYPAESNHLIDLTALRGADVAFFVGRLGGEVRGFGACVNCGEYGEIKRLYVPDRFRGAGVGRLVMQAIEEHARTLGLRLLRTESGVKQPEALALYKKIGFYEIGPFGGYGPDPLSIFLEKNLKEPSR
jgi:putative acetyltransferase